MGRKRDEVGSIEGSSTGGNKDSIRNAGKRCHDVKVHGEMNC